MGTKSTKMSMPPPFIVHGGGGRSGSTVLRNRVGPAQRRKSEAACAHKSRWERKGEREDGERTSSRKPTAPRPLPIPPVDDAPMGPPLRCESGRARDTPSLILSKKDIGPRMGAMGWGVRESSTASYGAADS
jgi:hypothetical protein